MRINAEKDKLVQDDLDDLNAMIARLKALIPGTEREIDRQYYYCYGDGAVTVEETGGVVVYIVRGESFGNYLLSVYGQSVKAGGISAASYSFYRVDIFSPIWTAKYGFPPVIGDFSCAASGSHVSGQGTITGISADGFTIRHSDGHEMRLHAKDCSRIESVTKLPKIGQNLAFRAVASSAGGYNIVGATCW